MKEIILASGSPRRKELLGLLRLPFRVLVSDADEEITECDPGEIVKELSCRKALAVADTLEEGLIIGADTIVVLDGKILGKPRDRENAREMLQALQGRSHSVFTGVTLIGKCAEQAELSRDSFFEETIVHVHEMNADEIEGYLDTGDPFDKAGSYGIQGPFAAFVDGIEGDYQNVVGLPVAKLYQHLKMTVSEE